MKQDFSDRASFLKATIPLKEATFYGRDLVHDAAARTLTMTLTRADQSRGGAGSFMSSRRPAYLKTLVTVRHVTHYKQYLTGETYDVYVFDRAEVGRGGQELTFFFRPGDRAVIDVESIDGFVEDAGRATSAPKKPPIVNPLVKQEKKAADRKGSAVGKILGRRGTKGR